MTSLGLRHAEQGVAALRLRRVKAEGLRAGAHADLPVGCERRTAVAAWLHARATLDMICGL